MANYARSVTFSTYTKIKSADHNANWATVETFLNTTKINDDNIQTNGITRGTKLSLGTASHVIINDGTGAMSSEASLAITRGGTGAATANAGFNALAPTTTRGDLIYRDATVNARLAVGAANRVLRSDGTDPSWGQVVLTTDVSGTLPVANGGTGAATAAAGFDALAPTTTRGDLIARGASSNTRLAIGSANRVLRSDGTDPSWSQVALATDVSGTLPATNGGTGQSTATTGDTLYASAANTWSKLAAGTNGHILTLASGVPSWAANTGGTTYAWSGYHDNNSTWTRGASTFGTPAIDASSTFTEIVNKNFGTVTSYNDGTPGNNYPGITFTPVSGVTYLITAIVAVRGASVGASGWLKMQTSGGTAIAYNQTQFDVADNTNSVTIQGLWTAPSSSSINIELQLAASATDITIVSFSPGVSIMWTVIGV